MSWKFRKETYNLFHFVSLVAISFNIYDGVINHLARRSEAQRSRSHVNLCRLRSKPPGGETLLDGCCYCRLFAVKRRWLKGRQEKMGTLSFGYPYACQIWVYLVPIAIYFDEV